MKIAFDFSSGDKEFKEYFNASKEFLKKNPNYEIIAFVTKDIDLKNFKHKNISYEVCEEKIFQKDGPLQIKRKKNSTLAKSIQSCIDKKTDAIVSSSSSSTFLFAAFTMSKPLKEGIKPAFAPIISNLLGRPKIALDVGANLNSNSEMLVNYAKIGVIFAKVLGISDNPRVRLLNIGSEKTKGNKLMIETHEKLLKDQNINFLGNVESNEILLDGEDVILTDAISGNISLKAYEGSFKLIGNRIKSSIKKSLKYKIMYLINKKFFKDLEKLMNNDEIGGAIILGVENLMIKSHGGSGYKYLLNSLNVAKDLIEKKLIEELKKGLINE